MYYKYSEQFETVLIYRIIATGYVSENSLFLVSDGAFISGSVSTSLPNTFAPEQYVVTKINT